MLGYKISNGNTMKCYMVCNEIFHQRPLKITHFEKCFQSALNLGQSQRNEKKLFLFNVR